MRVLAGLFVAALLLVVPFHVAAQEITEGQVEKVEAEVLEWAETWMDGSV